VSKKIKEKKDIHIYVCYCRFYLLDEFCHLPRYRTKINWHIGRQLLFCQSLEIRFKITIVCVQLPNKYLHSVSLLLFTPIICTRIKCSWLKSIICFCYLFCRKIYHQNKSQVTACYLWTSCAVLIFSPAMSHFSNRKKWIHIITYN